MHKLIALLAAVLTIAPALAADAPAAKPPASAAAGAPKPDSIKPPLAVPAAPAPAAAAAPPPVGPKSAVVAPKDLAGTDKEAAAQREVANKIAERLAAMRKEQALRKAQAKSRVTAKHRAKQASGAEKHGAHWSYEGATGPNRWGKLNPAWAKCDSGERQSPIDIRDGLKLELEPVDFAYRPLRFSVLDNGHTIQVNPSGGNRMMVMGRSFDLIQLHFHRPAEERINGRGYPMVAHLVHKDSDGKLAVVAVLMEEGKANGLVQTVWNNLPLEKNEPAPATVTLDIGEILPERREYYTFMGSLTTPPCSEGVLWVVLKEPIQVSAQQLAIFARLYPMNARPVQARAGRMIKESN